MENENTNANANNSSNSNNYPAFATVNRVTVKVPPFWKSDPAIWFAQVEAQFHLGGITNDLTKYNHIVGAVDTEILSQVSDIIQKPPDTDRYNTLKNRLIELFTDSQESKLRRLLGDMRLGDKRPSMLLNEMQRLGGMACSTQLLKTLWLQQLPVTTQSCLTMSTGTIEELARLADKISEIDQQRMIVNTVSESTTEILKTLVKEVNELKVAANRNDNRSRSLSTSKTSRSRSVSRARYGKWRMGENGYCFYHDNFGKKARKCVDPCEYTISKGNQHEGN
ncbi:unnamed protein product [Macrosiphum euphorbiae]|uniref:DUF7041 domain-containing protein n=1 Tax=Macrosiphum euphorbiae TaxID=13131 RepID=A0AAV0XKC5_9HEMI|nr:unnamed protein product [Macrosiphum euphorbiae]